MHADILLDVAGRRRSPATLPGYHTGRQPRNKGRRYPADPPTVEEKWGWAQLRPWLEHRLDLPIGPLFCVVNGPTAGAPWIPTSARTQLRRLAVRAGVRRRFAPHQLRHAHASRWRGRGCR